MPEERTRVCLYIPNGKEEHSYVIHGKRDFLDGFTDRDVKVGFTGFLVIQTSYSQFLLSRFLKVNILMIPPF